MREKAFHIAVLLSLLAPMPLRAEVMLPPAIAMDPWLQEMRRSMLAGARMSDTDLRTLADAGEGLAAARLAQRLEERGDPALQDDAAHYYSIAVYVDRDFALPRLLAILRRPDLQIGPARLNNLRDVLERETNQRNPVAVAGLADLLLRGTPFGLDVPRARDLLLIAAEDGDTKAAIRLALSHFQGAPDLPPDPEAARPALAIAMTSPDPGVQAMARTLANTLIDGAAFVAALTPATASLRPRARPAFPEGATP